MTGLLADEFETGYIAVAEEAELLASAGMALKNMLAVSEMASELLFPAVESLGNAQLDRYAAMISHSTFGMRRLADNLTMLAAILRGVLVPDRQSYDIADVWRRLVASAAHLTAGKRKLLFQSSAEHITICADRRLMDRLLLNLLSNSLQNTTPDAAVTVSILAASDGRLVLTVHDDGAGIERAVLPTVWSRYGRSKDLAGRTGVGIGLMLVQHIARLHGGSAVLESRSGTGTAVTVSLPMELRQASVSKTESDEGVESGLEQLLTELSGAIGFDKYTQIYMD